MDDKHQEYPEKAKEDNRSIPRLSLGYGIVMAIISILITWSAWQAHSFVLAIAMIAGFFFIGPALAIGLYSIPFMMDRDIDAVTAIITSVAAVLRNKRVMLYWGMLIVGGILLGISTGFISLAVTLPVIGHATWHAYQEVVDVSEYVLPK